MKRARITRAVFLQKASEIHGSTYDYSLSRTKRSDGKINIVCYEHGSFFQKPDMHLRGNGCPDCAIKKKTLTLESFLLRAEQKHGNTYIYTKTKVTRSGDPIIIGCRYHGDFLSSPSMHLNRGDGCPKCGRIETGVKQSLSTEACLSKARKLHGSKFKYVITEIGHGMKGIEVTCKAHGSFVFTPTHLLGLGCSKCSHEAAIETTRRKKEKEFFETAPKIHKNKYKYTKVRYVRWNSPVCITCPKHGDYMQSPYGHLLGYGCSGCCKTGRYSQMAINAIEKYAKSRRWKNIQHAEKGGEYSIPGTRYKADGYHAASDTVIEFHGSAFHGDPRRYSSSSKPNPFSTKTAKQLYAETMKRDREIRKRVTNLIILWESDT